MHQMGARCMGAEEKSRQAMLIEMAESLLHDYYTRFSQDPASLASLYLESAEAIITGKELNIDAELMMGRRDIAAFFSSPRAAIFRQSKIIVDALHPLASPICGVSLFSKGRIWLFNAETAEYSLSTVYHVLYLAPKAKTALFSHPPALFIANEFLHFASLPLFCSPQVPHFLNSASITNCYPQSDAPTTRTLPPAVSRETESKEESVGGTTSAKVDRRDELSLHATLASDASSLKVDGVVSQLTTDAISESIQEVLKKPTAKCVGVVKPKTMNNDDVSRLYFFLQFESTETVQALKDLGKLTIGALQITLSPRRRFSNRPGSALSSNRLGGGYGGRPYFRGGRGGFNRGRGGFSRQTPVAN